MKSRFFDMTFLFAFLAIWNTNLVGQTFQIYDGDTINVVDENNMKQGYWIYFGKTKNKPGYEPDQIVEEGSYKSNRKHGIWKKYFPNKTLNSEINYVNNRPNGKYKVYYENGQLQEEGSWKNNRNVGHFARFYENGEKQQDFTFNSTGKREGRQEYYYENGQLMIEGDWNGGRESGEIKEYYPNGDTKSVKFFNGGMIDAAKTQTFEPKQPIVKIEKEDEEVKEAPILKDPLLLHGDPEVKESPGEKVVVTPKQSDPNKQLGYFNGTGNTTLYRKDRQPSQKGYFKDGKLMDGKWYRYDENGLLENIEVYKNGKYVGDGVIEK